MADAVTLAEKDIAQIGATFRLGTNRTRHPELQRREASARLDLAAAILRLDAAEMTVEVRAGARHTLHEQVAVERALKAYGQALADLVRGEDSTIPERFRSRDAQHIREDLTAGLASALAQVFGADVPADARAKADAITAGTNGYDESQWCLTETLSELGPKVFGALTLHNIKSKNSLMGQSETITTVRSLAGLGLTVADLGWPNEELKPQFRS